MRALEFFGGVPQLIVPDNARTGVSRNGALHSLSQSRHYRLQVPSKRKM